MIFWIVLLVFWSLVFLYIGIRFLLSKSLTRTELIFLIVSNFLSAVFANEVFGYQYISYLIGLY